MSRLTERQSAGYDLIEMKGAWCDNYCGQQSKATCRDCAIWKAIQKLAHYEDLEEQGRLIEQKQGRWVSVDFNKIMCSECKHIWNIMNNEVENFKCCPNCGVKMAELKGTEE